MSWKMSLVLESPKIYLWFKLTEPRTSLPFYMQTNMCKYKYKAFVLSC